MLHAETQPGRLHRLPTVWAQRARLTATALTLGTALLAPSAGSAEGIDFPSAAYDPASTHNLVAFASGDSSGLFANYWNGKKWVWQNQHAPASKTFDGVNSLVYDGATKTLFDFTNDLGGNIWANYWTGSTWAWQNESNPGVPVYGSDAVYVPGGHPLVDFVLGADGGLYDTYYDGGKWVWESQGKPPGTSVASMPGGALYEPAASSIIVFVNGANGHLYDKYWTGKKWAWEDQGSPPGTSAVFAPSAIVETLAPHRIKAYVEGANGHLYEKNGSAWKDLGTPPGTTVASAPSAVYQPTAHPYTVFVVGANGHLYDKYFNSSISAWTWQDQGIPPGDSMMSATHGLCAVYAPTPVGMNLVVFGVGFLTGDLYLKYWDGAKGWQWENNGRP